MSSQDKDAGATIPVLEKGDDVSHPLIPADKTPVEAITTKPKVKVRIRVTTKANSVA